MSLVIQGFTRFRKHQWGIQGSNASVIDTAAVAIRALPLRGTPEVNPNWTFDDKDEGSLHKISAPSQRRWDITETLAGSLAYDDWPFYAGVSLIGGITPTGGGSAKTWTHQPSSLTADALDFNTEEFGDDVTNDWFQMVGGHAESLTLTGNDDMGPLQVSLAMRYAKAAFTGSTDYPVSGTVPTPNLTVDDNPAWVYLADGELFLDDTYSAIGTTKIADALHSLELTVTNNFDLKAFANGSNTRFQLRGYGRGEQELSLQLTFAKTPDTVGVGSESDDWMSNEAVKRFAELRFTSPRFVTGTTPYSLSISLPLWYMTRAEGEIGGNTTVVLTGNGAYDSDLGRAIKTVCVNALTSVTA